MRIKLSKVNKYYNRSKVNEVHALVDVNLEVGNGEIVCIKGPSGSGKSTLLSVIGCIYPPTNGRAKILDKQLSRLPDHFLTRHRRENIGFIFQRFNLIESLSVIDNITLPLLPLGIKPSARKAAAFVLLDKFGITQRQSFRVDRISGGEMQRVAIARALICDPPIILADEPTAHLDNSLSHQFMAFMALLKEEGKTIVIASHDSLVYRHQAIDRVFTMTDGRLTEGM